MGTSIPLVEARRFDAAQLAARKGATTVSVCLPARNEERTLVLADVNGLKRFV